jgi:hypothetical protein
MKSIGPLMATALRELGLGHFPSRHAHDLTYSSCQQGGQSNRFWHTLARDLGRDEAELRTIFGRYRFLRALA